jgi:formylglycine-generating enzyme required for sulfatase activity
MDSGETNQDALGGNSNLAQFRIFLASPGDVPLERKLAKEAIIHIGSERRFRNRIDLEIIAWDQPGAAVAMEAGLTPQEAIAQGLPKPEDCDMAVIILWSRIGTQLPSNFELKADGSPYLSGTEWEYLNALKGYRANRKPSVWVYRKKGAPKPDLDDPDYAAIVDQWSKVKKFFAAFSNPDGSLAGGINPYETPDDFRQQFESHLRDRLDKLLESLPPPTPSQTLAKPTAAPSWRGSPYPGLKAFMPEQAPIYFGRGREVDQLLQQFADPNVRFVAVVGVSGSGKSSLVKAGLLPRLRSGIIGHSPWVDLIFTPGERGANPFLAMAYALNATLNLSGQTEIDIARALQATSSDSSIYPTAEKHLHALLKVSESNAEVLLVVDQFEELFTQCHEEERQAFLALLEYVVTLPRIRAIATLRADFYERAIQEPILANLLRQDRSTFPLAPPAIGAIYQMIIRPAEAAGLELQDGLTQRLLDDAGIGPGAMALIAYTLNQLYDHGVKESQQSAHYLSLDAYDKFGGVEGAVQQCAETALKVLPKHINLTADLPILFSALVEVNEQEVATRRRAPLKQLPENAKTIADRLVEARLLVSSKGKDNQPMLEVAHEIVLSGWDKLQLWIVTHSVALRARRDLEQTAGEWDKASRPGSALRTGAMLKRYENSAVPRSETAEDYLTACKRRRTLFRAGLAGLGLLAIMGIGLFVHLNKSSYGPALAARALVVELGLWPVPKPKMVTIPAESFEMRELAGDDQPDELLVHPLTFRKPFEMGEHEVTFDEYDLFAAATGREKPSDQGWGRGQRPAINVSWNDAVAYAEWLSAHTGAHYRLPSEAEWEYAARAGTTTTPRYWPENAEGETDAACVYANVFDKQNEALIRNNYAGITWQPFNCVDEFPFTAPVGKFKDNPWKLYDMFGNVWEWTQDCYIDNNDVFSKNGTAREEKNNSDCSHRVLRGGSWLNEPQLMSSAIRLWVTPDYRYFVIGFRLARTP